MKLNPKTPEITKESISNDKKIETNIFPLTNTKKISKFDIRINKDLYKMISFDIGIGIILIIR